MVYRNIDNRHERSCTLPLTKPPMHLLSVVALVVPAAASARLTANPMQAKIENLSSPTSKADDSMMRTDAYNSRSNTLPVCPKNPNILLPCFSTLM